MKKILLFIGLILPIAVSNIYGQVISMERNLFVQTGSKEIIRIHTGNKTLTYKNSLDTLTHSFFYCYSSTFRHSYTLPPIANLYGNGIYTVNDMIIVGNKCFICGKLKMPIGQIIGPTDPPRDVLYSDDMGYIGMIDLDSIEDFSDGNLKIKFSLIKKTHEILKMAVECHLSDTLIGMIGISDNIQTTSCIVAMKGGGNTWTNKVYALPEWTETLTDIVFTDKSLVTSSRFDGEPWTFGVRYINTYDLFYNDLINEYCHGTKFLTQYMHNSTNTYPTYHPNDAKIRMVAIPNTNDVTIAYRGRDYYNQNPNDWRTHSILFYINGTMPYNITMTDAMMTIALFHSSCNETFYDMIYNSSNNTIALMQYCLSANYIPNNLVLLFNWNTNSQKTVYPYEPTHWTSLDIDGNNIWLVGRETTNNKITQNYLNQQNTSWYCVLEEDYPSSHLQEIPEPNTFQSDVYLLHSTYLMEWVHKSRVPVVLNITYQDCIDYGDRF